MKIYLCTAESFGDVTHYFYNTVYKKFELVSEDYRKRETHMELLIESHSYSMIEKSEYILDNEYNYVKFSSFDFMYKISILESILESKIYNRLL
jgi:hypothetical protein